MAFELPSVPNFNTQPVQMPSPLDQYGKMLQLKTLQGQQGLIPGQLQEQQEAIKQQQLQTQQMQLQQQSQAAMVKAWSDPDFASTVTGSTGKDIAGKVGFEPGFDPNAMVKSLVSKGVLPKDAMAQAASFLELSKNLSLKTKDDLSNYKDAHQQLANLLSPITSMKVEDAGPALAAVKQKVLSGAIPGLDPRDIQLMQQADLTHLQPVLNLLGLASSVADFHKGQSEAEKAATEAAVAQQKVIPANGGLSPEAQQQVQQGVQKDVAVATDPLVQGGKIQVAAAEGQARAATEINTKRQETSDTQFQTAIGADERLNRMEKSYTDAVTNHNQQAMLALLTDHIGMTLGLQKGARITKDILNEAAQSQPWRAKMAAKFDSDGYLSGVNLSPGQMKQMLDLGYSARENAWGAASSTAQLYGVKPPPNATAIYNKRDPNARIYDKSMVTMKAPNGATKQVSADQVEHYKSLGATVVTQ